MRREERVTVQGPVKEQQPDGMSHRGSNRGSKGWGWGSSHGCKLFEYMHAQAVDLQCQVGLSRGDAEDWKAESQADLDVQLMDGDALWNARMW